MAEVTRSWFLLLFTLGIAGFVTTVIRFRIRQEAIERKIGPLPTPVPFVAFCLGLVILFTRMGEIQQELPGIRLLGVALSFYSMIMIPWTIWTMGRFLIPGAAVLQDHALVTSGPFRFVRHPLLSAVIVLWLGAGLGTLNWLMLVLLPLLAIGVYKSSGHEEQLLRAKFGAAHEAYTAKTARFIPKVW